MSEVPLYPPTPSHSLRGERADLREDRNIGPYASYPECSRANFYPWSPFPLRRAHLGPGPHKTLIEGGKSAWRRSWSAL